MDHYIDIKLLPDPEFAPTLLMNALYSKLHRALVQLGCTDVGLSFPDFDTKKRTLGERIRLHGGRKRLESLMALSWLTGMNDHVHAGAVLAAPEHAGPIRVRRVQAKSSAERIRRRQMRRHNLSFEEALEKIPDAVEERLSLPYLTVKSQSTEQTFRLFVSQQEAEFSAPGVFNAYGMSCSATLPFF